MFFQNEQDDDNDDNEEEEEEEVEKDLLFSITDDLDDDDFIEIDGFGDEKIGHNPPFPGFGIFCCIMCGVIFSFNNLLVKLIKSNSAVQLTASRCIAQYLFLMPYVTYNWKYKSHDIYGPPGMFKYLIIRGLTGSTAGICLYESIQRISVGDAVTLSFANVIFAGAVGYYFLDEPFTVLDACMSLSALVGIILISKPSFLFGRLDSNSENVLGVIFGLSAGMFAGVTVLVLRKLGKKTHASLNVFYYSFCGSITTSIITFAKNNFAFPCRHEVPAVILLGLTGILSQILMTLGLHYESTNTFAVLRSFQIVFVFILQVVMLQDEPSTLSLIGSGLIFLSVFTLAARKIMDSTLYVKTRKLWLRWLGRKHRSRQSHRSTIQSIQSHRSTVLSEQRIRLTL